MNAYFDGLWKCGNVAEREKRIIMNFFTADLPYELSFCFCSSHLQVVGENEKCNSFVIRWGGRNKLQMIHMTFLCTAANLRKVLQSQWNLSREFGIKITFINLHQEMMLSIFVLFLHRRSNGDRFLVEMHVIFGIFDVRESIKKILKKILYCVGYCYINVSCVLVGCQNSPYNT